MLICPFINKQSHSTIQYRCSTSRLLNDVNMHFDSILCWIDSIETAYPPIAHSFDQSRSVLGKRTRFHESEDQDIALGGPHLPTPSSSITNSLRKESLPRKKANCGMSSSSKRRRADDNLSDEYVFDDSTPKAPRLLPMLTQDEEESQDGSSNYSRGSEASRVSSSVSNKSSPTKQYRNAELQITGFRVASFVVDLGRLPPSLKTLRQKLIKISNGEEIIPLHLKREVRP